MTKFYLRQIWAVSRDCYFHEHVPIVTSMSNTNNKEKKILPSKNNQKKSPRPGLNR